MGLLDWLKKPNKKDNNAPTELEKVTPNPPYPSSLPVSQAGKIISFVKTPLFKVSETIKLQVEDYTGWDDLFVTGKVTEKLPGFDLRSKRKVKLHYYGASCFIVEANKTLYSIGPSGSKKICLEYGSLDTTHIREVNERCAILSSEDSIGYLDFDTGLVTLFQFSWHPFRVAIGKEFWLVSTRETTEGPGELYCFSLKGEYLWGLQFGEEFQTAFGLIKATAYHLHISEDNTQIIVSTMDRVYRLNQNGELISRIALADLREAEIKMKEAKRRADLPKNPQTKEELIRVISHEMSEKMVGGMIRAASLNTPLAGFILDPLTSNIFILEDKGRLTAWNSSGKLLWAYSFNEAGNYIGLVDDSLAVSLKTGDIFWLNQQGDTLFSAKLPKQAKAVFAIPDQEKYLIACEDGRRYELDKQTGELIQGPEGDKGMRLFSFHERILFYDGYLWASPIGFTWETYRPRKAIAAASSKDITLDQEAPQVKLTKRFNKVWTFNDSDTPIHYYAIDKKNNLIYVGRRKIGLSPKEMELETAAFRTNSFARWNDVACYDFSLKQMWSNSFFSELTLLTVSPGGKSIFVGLWDQGLSYDTAKLVVLDFNGNKESDLITTANPIFINFIDDDRGILEIAQGASYFVHRIDQSKWVAEQNPQILTEPELSKSGLNESTLGSYRIVRKDKKTYQLSHLAKTQDLKLGAAIYEALLSPDSNAVLLRIGNRTLRAFSNELDELWEIKTKLNIKSIIKGSDGFLILSKEELQFYNWKGDLIWRLGCPPKSDYNTAVWLEKHKAFFWGAGDWNYFQISLISPEGQIKKSQLFKEVPVHSYYPRVDVLEDGSHFILQTGGSIECYEI